MSRNGACANVLIGFFALSFVSDFKGLKSLGVIYLTASNLLIFVFRFECLFTSLFKVKDILSSLFSFSS